MAQQMRVRDQDIIVKKVVKALEEKGLQDLKDKFSNDSQVKFLKELLEELITVKTKVRELRDQESALEKSIHRGIEDFNTSNDLDNNKNQLNSKLRDMGEKSINNDGDVEVAKEILMKKLSLKNNSDFLIE